MTTDTTILGGGLCGLATALMLARDGRRVTVLERDTAPVPDSPERAWESWARDGVAQFRQAHFMQARGRQVLADELPDVHAALRAAGALELRPSERMPDEIEDRAPHPGDDALTTLTARRSTLEHVLARAAEAEPGVTVLRGVGAAAIEPGGVRDDRGRFHAGLVIDAMGRRSPLPKLLGRPVAEEVEDRGFVYYTRYFRGTEPRPRTAYLAHLGSFSIATLPADAGLWSVTLFASPRDRPLKRLHDERRWTAVVAACPKHAHWLEGEPVTGVLPMGGVTSRIRPAAPAPGVLSVADAWACTNPSLGRGMALGLMHAALLRRVLRDGEDWAQATAHELEPWYRASVMLDRARVAEIDRIVAGDQAPPPAPADRVRAALTAAADRDAKVFRAALEISNCLALPKDVLARPGLVERAVDVANGYAAPAAPSRDELLALVG